MVRLMLEWLGRYPIASIEDPLAEDDAAGLAAFTTEAGKRVQIIGDDFLVTNAARVKDAASRGICNAVLVKPNQAGTLTEARAALDAVLADLQTLAEPDRAALLMRAEDQMPYEEIAAALGTTPGAVKVRVHRARRRLAELRMRREGLSS